MRASALIALTALAWSSLAGAASPRLVEARKRIDDLELEAALKVLDAVEKTEGNDRQTLRELYTLQGLAYGTLGKEAKTRDAFRKLLIIAPDSTIPSDLPPRVRTPFFEAKEWASTNGPLLATPGAELGDGLVRSVKLVIEKDVLRLARSARFHFKVDGVEQRLEAPFTGGKASVPILKPAVAWWAEVLSERKGVLLEVGSEQQPREESTGSAPAAVASAGVDSAGPTAGGWRRPTGIALLSAGAVAAGVGVVFGFQSVDARARVTNATRDGEGRVTTVTQREAVALEASARSQATVANVLFGIGGAFAATGLVLIILGPSGEPAMALSPVPGGVVVSGSFW